MHVVLRKGRKVEAQTDHKTKKKRLRATKSAARKKILHHRSSTIIQLHAIVYAVIYYDFRTTLWRLSV